MAHRGEEFRLQPRRLHGRISRGGKVGGRSHPLRDPAELGADLADDLQRRLVGIDRPPGEELQDTRDVVTDQDREGKRSLEAERQRHLQPGQVVVIPQICPRRLSPDEDPAGQAAGFAVSHGHARRTERLDPRRFVDMPDRQRSQTIDGPVRRCVGVAGRPAGMGADLVDGDLERLLEGRCLVGRERHLLQQPVSRGRRTQRRLGPLRRGDVVCGAQHADDVAGRATHRLAPPPDPDRLTAWSDDACVVLEVWFAPLESFRAHQELVPVVDVHLVADER